MTVSGDGFVTVADGTVRWGRFGAAGVLVRCAEDDGSWWYFLARRSEWCHQGGCWAMPGGALHHGEAPLDGALREFAEEIGEALGDFRVVDLHEDDHGGWSYWTIVVDVPDRFEVPPIFSWETDDARWVSHREMSDLELFDAFAATLERLDLAG